MKRSPVWIAGMACYGALITTCLGATGLVGNLTLVESIASDRKAGVMVCNGGFAYGWSFVARLPS